MVYLSPQSERPVARIPTFIPLLYGVPHVDGWRRFYLVRRAEITTFGNPSVLLGRQRWGRELTRQMCLLTQCWNGSLPSGAFEKQSARMRSHI